MDGIKTLYGYLKKNKAIDDKETFQSFSTAMEVPEYRNNVYKGMYDRKLTMLTQVEFDEKFFGIQPTPKKKDVQAPSAPPQTGPADSLIGQPAFPQTPSGASRKESTQGKTEPAKVAEVPGVPSAKPAEVKPAGEQVQAPKPLETEGVKAKGKEPGQVKEEKAPRKLITPAFPKASFFAETPPLVFAPEVREEMQADQRQINQPGALPGQAPQPRLQARPEAVPGKGFEVMKPGEGAVPEGLSFAPTGTSPVMEVMGNEDIDEWATKTNIAENKRYADKTLYKDAKTKDEKLKKEQIEADNALLYSRRASEQVNEATSALEGRYGKDFGQKAYAIERSIAEFGGVPGEVMEANGLSEQDVRFFTDRVFSDADYKRWRSGIQGYSKGYTKYQELINSGELKEFEELKKELQRGKDVTLTDDVGYGEALNRYYSDTAVRTLGRLVSGVLTLPRTATELAEFALGAELDQKGAVKKTVNKLGDAGDQISEFLNIYIPDYSFAQEGIFEGKTTEKTIKLLHQVTQAGADMFALGIVSRGSKAGVWAVSSLRGQQEAWNEAEELGIYDPGEKALYAATKGISIGFLEAYLGSIETKIGGSLSGKLSKQTVRDLIRGKKIDAIDIAGAVSKDVMGEVLEEVATEASSDIMKSAFNKKADAPEISGLDEYKDIVATTVVLTALMGGPASISQASMANAYNIDRISQVPDKFKSIINALAEEGEISRELANDYIDRGSNLAAYSNGLGKTVNETDRGQLLSLEWARMELQSQANNEAVMPAVREVAKEQLKEIEAMQKAILTKTPEQKAKEADQEAEALTKEVKEEEVKAEVVEEAEAPAATEIAPEVMQEIEQEATREVSEITIPEVSQTADGAIDAFTERFSDADGNIDIGAIEADMARMARGETPSPELNSLVETVRKELAVDAPKALEILEDYVAEVKSSLEQEAEAKPVSKAPETRAEPKAKSGADIKTEIESAPDKMSAIETAIEQSQSPAEVDNIRKAVAEAGLETEAEGLFPKMETKKQELLNKLEDGKQIAEGAVKPEAQDIGTPQAEGAAAGPATEAAAGEAVQAGPGKADTGPVSPAAESQAGTVEGRKPTPSEQKLAEAPIPEMTTPALAAELYDQGAISQEDYLAAVNEAEGIEMPQEAKQRIEEAKPKLRQIDDVDVVIRKASLEHTDRIISAENASEMERIINTPVVAETENEIAISVPQSVKAAMAALGGVKRGDFFVFPKDQRDAALAAAFARVTPDPNMPPIAPPSSPAFLFYNSPFGYGRLKSMADAISKAAGLSEKVKAAKRYLGQQRKVDPVVLSKRLGEKFGVDVSFDRAEMASILQEAGKDPSTLDRVKGFVYKGKVYINPDFADAETPIHEFGHLWARALKQNSPEGFEQIRSAIEGTVYMDAVRNNPDYAGLDEDAMVEEAVAQAIGTRGAAIVEPTLWSRVKDSFQALYTYIADTLGFDGPSVADIKFAQMADAMALDLLSDNGSAGTGLSLIDPTTQSLIGKNEALRGAVVNNLSTAVMMELDGNSDSDIFTMTGWLRGADGVWKYDGEEMTSRMSIPSSAALATTETEYSVSDFFQNEDAINSTPLSEASILVSPDAKEMGVETRDGKRVIVVPSSALKGPSEAVKAEIATQIQRAMRPEIGQVLNEKDAVAKIISSRKAFEKDGPGRAYANMAGETAANLKTAIKGTESGQMDMSMADFSVLSQMGIEMPKPSVPGNDIAFLFGKRRTADAATVIAARQIIDDAVQNNTVPFTGINDPNAGSLLANLREMGLSDAQIRKQLSESAAASGKIRITANDIQLASNKERLKTLGQKLVNSFKWGFLIGGVMPKTMQALNLQRKSTHAAASYEMLNSVRKMDLLIARMAQTSGLQKEADKAKGGLVGRIVEAAASLQRGVGRMGEEAQTNEQVFRDLAMSALENEEAAQFLDKTPVTVPGVGTYSLFDIVSEIRQKQNEFSKALIMEGIVGPNLALAILKRAGLDIESLKISSGQPTGIFSDEEASIFVKALSKRPFMRNAQEQNLVQGFLDNAPQGWGSYVYRSYQKFEDPEWLEKVRMMPEVWERARASLVNVIREDLANEADLLRLKEQGIGDQEQQLKDRVVEEIDALQNQIDMAEQALADIQQRISDQQDMVNQGTLANVNKNYAAWEQSRKARLDKLKDSMATLQDFAALGTNELLDFADIPHSEASALTNPMRRIYSEVVKLKNLNMRLIEAQGASYERMNNLKDMLDPAVIEAKMEQIARSEEGGGFGVTSRMGAISQELTKRRKDIPVEIRDLMGEVRDPRQAVIRSTVRLSQAIANARFQNEMLAAGLQEGWIKEALPGGVAPKGYVLIAPKGSPSMGPLAGFYATEDVALELKAMEYTPKGNSLSDNLSKLYLRATGFVKISKTVYSPDTQFRNMYSNVMMAGANGWLFEPGVMKALGTSKQAFKFAMSDAEMKLATELREAGVLGNSISRGELEEATSWFSGDKPIEDSVYAFSEFAPKSVLAKGTEAAKHYYQATDEALKYFAFMAEANRYGKALYGKDFMSLTGMERDKVKAIAVKNVRGITPDYSLQSRAAAALRKFPLGPTFVSFPLEMVRTQVNWFEIVSNDLKNPETRSIGVKRVATSLAWNAGLHGLYQAAKALIGMDDEEEKAIEPGLAPWERNQPRMFISKDKLSGELTYFNFGNIDPYANWKSSIYTYMNSPKESRVERIMDSLKSFMEPFLATEITAAYSMSIMKGVNVDDGKELYIKDRSVFEKDNMKAILNATTKNFSPGVINTVVDFIQVYKGNTVDQYGNVKNMESAIFKAFGLKANAVNPKSDNFVYFWGKRANDDISAQRKNFSKKVGTFVGNLEKRIDNLNTPVETVLQYWEEQYPILKENELHDTKYYNKSVNKWKELTGRLLRGVTYDPDVFQKSFNVTGMSSAERDAIISGGPIPPLNYGTRFKESYSSLEALKDEIEIRREEILAQRESELKLEAEKKAKKK